MSANSVSTQALVPGAASEDSHKNQDTPVSSGKAGLTDKTVATSGADNNDTEGSDAVSVIAGATSGMAAAAAAAGAAYYHRAQPTPLDGAAFEESVEVVPEGEGDDRELVSVVAKEDFA